MLAYVAVSFVAPANSDCQKCSVLSLQRHAGASIHAHLGAIFPPVLALASQRGKGDAASLAAQEVTRKVTAAVAEDGSYLLVAQVSYCHLTCKCIVKRVSCCIPRCNSDKHSHLFFYICLP